MAMFVFHYRPSTNFEMEGQRFLQDARAILSNPSNFNQQNACKIWSGTVDNKTNGLAYGIVYLRPPHERKKRSTIHIDWLSMSNLITFIFQNNLKLHIYAIDLYV
mgnify:CR=1 FL=1